MKRMQQHYKPKRNEIKLVNLKLAIILNTKPHGVILGFQIKINSHLHVLLFKKFLILYLTIRVVIAVVRTLSKRSFLELNLKLN